MTDFVQLRRDKFWSHAHTPAHDAAEIALLQTLLTCEGPMTHLLEDIAGMPITVHLLAQETVQTLPEHVAARLEGNNFLRRVSTLEAAGHVLLDSLSYIALDALPRDAIQQLLEGSTPIGHLLANAWGRRSFPTHDLRLQEELWAEVGHPDPGASRSSCIHTVQGPCVLLAETFRHGVLALSRMARVGSGDV